MTQTQPSAETVTLEIAEGRCKGYGFCVDVAPEVYGLDTSGFNERAGKGPWHVSATLAAAAQAGGAECPVRAIRQS